MQRLNENRQMENRPLGDLFSDLATDMSNLVRQEVALAKLEVTQKAKYLGRNVGYLVIGGAVAYAGLLAIIAAIIMLLAKVMPHWASALLVGVVVAGIAWLLIGKAMAALQQADLTPRETVETLKEDATWVKQQIK
ncbi:MAG TPA: phage holin family protein [Pyrinomonadaceae bacterium]|nr:phage holin family protein [Pyrinomonadaceae bacterium]